MEKEFVTYNQALKLKELGFDEPCFGFWTKIHGLFIMNTQGKVNEDAGECLAPTYSQAFRWFREKLKDSAIEPYSMVTHTSYNRRITFEEAELECLNKLIEIVETKD